ncbi:MAG: hypothetical protein ACOH2A_12655 [Sphingobacteriaceae bacterium]
MKKFFSLFICSLLLYACNSQQNNEKALQNTIIKLHDQVMPKGGLVISNKMRLDTLLNQLDSLKKQNPSLDTLAERQHIKALIIQLENADNAMSDWMNQFNPDNEDKKHADAMEYLKNEKQKIEAIDTRFSAVLDESNQYLSTYK